MQPWWPKFFGFYLLKIGNLSTEITSDQCTITHQISITEQSRAIQIFTNPYRLPFSKKSVDAVLLAHTLNYCIDPYGILCELDRVLVDDGWLIISHYNPLSLLGIGKLLPILRQHQPYSSRMFTQMRVLDWLNILNYQVMHQSCFHVLPWHKQGGGFINAYLSALGCVSLIIARKRKLSLIFNSIKFVTNKPSFNRILGATKNYCNLL